MMGFPYKLNKNKNVDMSELKYSQTSRFIQETLDR